MYGRFSIIGVTCPGCPQSLRLWIPISLGLSFAVSVFVSISVARCLHVCILFLFLRCLSLLLFLVHYSVLCSLFLVHNASPTPTYPSPSARCRTRGDLSGNAPPHPFRQ